MPHLRDRGRMGTAGDVGGLPFASTSLHDFIFFLKDQPAAVLPSTTMSRREYRRLHFIAKEDEEEDEDVL